MSGYSTVLVANTVLEKSFSTKKLITPLQLQRILYIVDCEYRKLTGKNLFIEPWSTFSYGPVLYSLYDKTLYLSDKKSLNSKKIKKYFTDQDDNSFVVDDADVKSVVERVFSRLITLSTTELCNLTRHSHEAWDEAFQNDENVLDDNKIFTDKYYKKIFA